MAIARDSNSHATASATTITIAHTITGSNTLLLVSVWDQSPNNLGTNVTGVTYNGVALTKLKYQVYNTNAQQNYIWGLIAPADGTHNIVVTRSDNTYAMFCDSESYTGVAQTGLPDATASNAGVGVNELSTTITTVANNCWVFLQSGVGSATAGTNATLINSSNTPYGIIFDNQTYGSITPAGNFTMTITGYSAQNPCNAMVSFAPYVAPAGPANLKSWNGLAKASIKSINGLAIASIKSINGLV